MTERWRKEAKVYDCTVGDSLTQMPSGELMVSADIAVDEETIERMREGRICFNCLEPQEIPFPEVCQAMKLPSGEPVGCFYRMRERQLLDLEVKYGGRKVRIGSRINYSDEFERMRQMDDFEQRTGIILPPGVKFPNETIEG